MIADGVQRWLSLGQLVDTHGKPIRMAMLPTVMPLPDGRGRVFYGALDPNPVSRIAFVDIDLARPTRALTAPVQVLDIGEPGHFDDNGLAPCAVLREGESTYLFYAGFQKQDKVPYTILTGLARSDDDGLTFERVTTMPLFERSSQEAFVRTAPSVLPTSTGIQAWYIGGNAWIADGDRVLPTYSLRTMKSSDIERWPEAGEICLAPVGDEIGFGRPWVMPSKDGFRIWYSIRKRSGYDIGYAESGDGINWRRLDGAVDLGPVVPGFDDEMRCYSFVLRVDSKLLMFYNGNGYGRSGIGVAALETE